jgi:uncharacterized membrane protein YbhN (UPF0104 family)
MGLVLVWLSIFAVAETFPALKHATPVFLLLIGLGFVGILFLLRAKRLTMRILRRIPFASFRLFTARLVASIHRSIKPQRLTYASLVSLVIWIASIALFAAYFQAGGSIPLTLTQIAAVFVASTLGLAIAVAPGGIGTFEAATVAALHSFGYSIPEALLLTIGFRIANNLVPAIVTLWLVATGQLKFRSLIHRLRSALTRARPNREPRR